MAFYLITGTSSGIGAALADVLLKSDNTLFCISRKSNDELIRRAKEQNLNLSYTQADINKKSVPRSFISEAFKTISSGNEPIVLINNAGVISPVKPVRALDEESIKTHFETNFFAPAMMISEFMNHVSDLQNPAIILNISSGAAYIPYEGWSIYGSSKAALNMFTKIAGMEWKRSNSRIFALAPGIIESPLQEQIRKTEENDFPQKNIFVQLHNENKLLSASFVAGIIAQTILDDRIETGAFVSLDDLKKLLQ